MTTVDLVPTDRIPTKELKLAVVVAAAAMVLVPTDRIPTKELKRKERPQP